MNPKISVILSVYNGEKYIREAVESVLKQTFHDFEFIIIDDGSTDKTPEILNSFSDLRIVRIKNEKNIKLIKSLNKGIEISHGEFLARMDADDICMPERFEKQVNFLKKNPDVGVLGTAVNIIDEKGRVISTLTQPLSHEGILWKMFFECAIIHPTVMARQELIKNAGGYDINFPHIEDTELWMRIILKTRFANLPDVLVAHRLHQTSIASTQSKVQYKMGLLLRERFFKSVLGIEIQPNINKWFSINETVLSQDEIKKGMDILSQIYAYITKQGFTDDNSGYFVHDDFIRKTALLKKGQEDVLFKKTIIILRKMLPASVRHKLKTKFLQNKT